MRFNYKTTFILIALLALLGCGNKDKKRHMPHALDRIEVFMHPQANQGVPLVLQWVFVGTEKAREDVAGLTALQFLQSEEELNHLHPRDIFVKKHTMLPGKVDVVIMPPTNLKAKVFLFAHFVRKGTNRWVVLPRKHLRVNIHRDTLDIHTRTS